ncbi:MAG: hypothetical protein HZC40_19900 [Chloroflexi bacterium]|nr:hypothetical protein [Chloroflexota bacterium]
MASATIATVIQMMETLPEAAQEQVVEHLREYLLDLQDEMEWDSLVRKSQPQLVAAARRAKKEIAEGLAKPLDYNQL